MEKKIQISNREIKAHQTFMFFDSMMTTFGCFEMLCILDSVRYGSDRTLNDTNIYVNILHIQLVGIELE